MFKQTIFFFLSIANLGANTPLINAIQAGNLSTVEILSHNIVELTRSDDDGHTPLMHAVREGDVKITRTLITALRKAKLLAKQIDAQSKNGITALMEAAYYGHKDIAQLLLENNADLHIENSENIEGQTALMDALDQKKPAVMALLLNHGARFDPEDRPLVDAAISGNLELVRILIEHRIDPKAGNDIGETPLSLAASYNHSHLIPILLKAGANVNDPDDIGCTPLNEAALSGAIESMQLLLKHKADINYQSNDGCTSLRGAVVKQHFKAVKLLLESKANPNINHKNGSTTLDQALTQQANEASTAIKDLLLEHGAKSNSLTTDTIDYPAKQPNGKRQKR